MLKTYWLTYVYLNVHPLSRNFQNVFGKFAGNVKSQNFSMNLKIFPGLLQFFEILIKTEFWREKNDEIIGWEYIFSFLEWKDNRTGMDQWASFFSFSFSQFYGRAHNAKAFLKCAPLDSVINFVRMIWFMRDKYLFFLFIVRQNSI